LVGRAALRGPRLRRDATTGPTQIVGCPFPDIPLCGRF
jgi:hypothetical protein